MSYSKNQKGLTLLELMVVIAILVALAGLLIPGMNGVTAQTKSGVCASDIQSVTRSILAYKAGNIDGHYHYPSNWDSLLTGPSGNLWAPTSSEPRGLDATLRSKLGAVTLSGPQATALFNAGIDSLRDLRTLSANDFPADAFANSAGMAAGRKVAVADFSSGYDIWQAAFPGLLSADLAIKSSNGILVVLGFGPNNDMVTSTKYSNVFCVPYYPCDTPQITYNRYLGAFYAGTDGITSTINVELKTVIGSDGTTLQGAQKSFRSPNE